jgi:hypothetical protein
MKLSMSVSAIAGVLLVTANGFSAAPPSPPEVEKAPAPQIVISFEHPILRENDYLAIRILLSNPSDSELQNVSISWRALPEDTELYQATCDSVKNAPKKPNKLTDNRIQIGKLPAQKDAGSVDSLDLCLHSTAVTNGDYNLLFDLRYDWMSKSGEKYAVVTSEKLLKSAFLGTDSFAGVPLALAGFIVPGLLFWLALDFWKTPWRIQGPTLGDKTVYSVLVSLLLVAMVSLSPFLKGFLDITQGLSLAKLGWLALLGGVAGMAVGGLDRLGRWLHTRRMLHPTDDLMTLLAKLLRLNEHRDQPRTRVTLNNGSVYEGSVGAQDTGNTYLVGWFRFRRDRTKARQTTEIEEAIAAGDLALAVELLNRYGFPGETRDFIHQIGADGSDAQTTDGRMQWENKDVKGPLTVAVKTGSQPIRLDNP